MNIALNISVSSNEQALKVAERLIQIGYAGNDFAWKAEIERGSMLDAKPLISFVNTRPTSDHAPKEDSYGVYYTSKSHIDEDIDGIESTTISYHDFMNKEIKKRIKLTF